MHICMRKAKKITIYIKTEISNRIIIVRNVNKCFLESQLLLIRNTITAAVIKYTSTKAQNTTMAAPRHQGAHPYCSAR